MTDKLRIPSLAEIKHISQGIYGAEGEAGYLARTDAIEEGAAAGRTIDGQPFADIWTDLQRRLALFNRNANRMVALLTFPVDRAQDSVAVPWTPDFEEATEFGRPGKVRVKRIYRGFPLKHYDLGYGFTQEFLDDSRAFEIQNTRTTAESGWWALQMRTAMNAIFDSSPDQGQEGVTVLPLYNADGEDPPNYRRWTHDGTHTHYLTTAGAALATTDLDTLETHLIHHGYGDDSLGGAGGTILVHFNRAQGPAIRALDGFVPATGSSVPIIVDGQVIGTQRAANTFGLTPEGYYGKLVFVENNEIPAGYLLALVSGGIFSDSNPVGMRRHSNPSARGLRLIEGGNARYPLIDSVYDGYVGAGVRHRGAAAVVQITAGAYVVPTL